MGRLTVLQEPGMSKARIEENRQKHGVGEQESVLAWLQPKK